MWTTFTQLARCPDILVVPVHCDSGYAQHPDCPVQQELWWGDRKSTDQCHPHQNCDHSKNKTVSSNTPFGQGECSVHLLVQNCTRLMYRGCMNTGPGWRYQWCEKASTVCKNVEKEWDSITGMSMLYLGPSSISTLVYVQHLCMFSCYLKTLPKYKIT